MLRPAQARHRKPFGFWRKRIIESRPPIALQQTYCFLALCFANSSGNQVGRSAIDFRAASEVGMPQTWKNVPRFFPQARLNRTIH